MTSSDLQRHPDKLLDAWLDDRLEADERRRVDEHLAGCQRCRTQVEVLRATVSAVRTGLPPEAAPAGLAERLRAALDAEDAARGTADAPADRAPRPTPRPNVPRPAARWPWAAVAAAVALAVVVATVFFWLTPFSRPGSEAGTGPPPGTQAGTQSGPGAGVEPGPPNQQSQAGQPGRADRSGDLLAAVDASYAELDRGALPAAFATTDPATVERRWRQASITFPARVLDLGAMGIHLAGGGATQLAGWPAAVTAYQGSDAGLLVCWMLEATVADLPAGAEVRPKNGFEFHIYRRGAHTLVFWEEGEVLCALAGTGDPESVFGLAVAKAMAPAARGTA